MFPGAPEICGDAVDQDCDGADRGCGWTGDHPVSSVATAGFTGADAMAVGADATGDGATDLAATTGAVVYVLPGPFAGIATTADARVSYEGGYWQSESFGSALALLDEDADGVADLAIGDSDATDPIFDGGAVYVMTGGATGQLTSDDAVAVLVGRTAYDQFGFSLAAGGDLTGDGVDDLLVGAPGLGLYGGAAIFAGPLVDATVDAAAAEIDGIAGNGTLGHGVGVLGDTDGDGVGDVIVGDRYADPFETGMAAVFLGPTTATDPTGADALLVGPQSLSDFGFTVEGGDVDGDGLADAVVAATREDLGGAGQGGVVRVYLGPVTGNLGTGDAWSTLYADVYSANLGQQMAVADTDGDGVDELVLGVPRVTGTDIEEGEVDLVRPRSGAWLLEDARSAVFRGEGERMHLGRHVAAADGTGDGRADLWVSLAQLAPGQPCATCVVMIPGI